MKTNKKILKVKNDQDCSYRVTIPLNIKDNVDKNTVSNYKISVYENGNVIKVERNSDTFYFERTDPLGSYFFKVQLINGDDTIEEQNLEINIREEFNFDIVSKEETKIEIDDKDFFTKIKEIINNTELKVGFRSIQWTSGSIPIIDDKNSEAVFKDLKKFNRDDDVVQVICKILSDESEGALLIWKCITMLKHFRAHEAINYVKLIAKRRYENKNETKFLHEECIKYLESVNSVKNRESVIDHLIYFASECFTPEARSDAVTSLIKTGKRNDERIIQYLFRIIDEDTNPTTKTTAIGGLANFNIISHSSEIEELLQDALPQVRQQTSSILLNNPLKLDFTILTKIFEDETDKATRKNLCNLLLKDYPDETKPYLLTVLEWEDEDYTDTILDLLNYGKDADFVVDKIAKYKNSDVYSVNLNKKIEGFLNKHKK